MAAAEIDDFFASTPSPSDLIEVQKSVQAFVEGHVSSERKIVLITSGGTLVPLEKNTVRFLDNFSTGTRGSISAEEFLSLDYAVIFLYRKSSLFPYTRVIDSPGLPALFDNLDCKSNGAVTLGDSLKEPFTEALQQYKKVKSRNLLLSIPYVSVFDYLHYLRLVSKELAMAGGLGMVFLAAAVSDFYIHPRNMNEHKIQSSSSLVVAFEQVPKMIGALVDSWSPKAFVISFKLETDEDLLISKSKKALEKYKHQVVIGNVLEKRKSEVVVVRSDMSQEEICLSNEEKSRGLPIERKLVKALVSSHSKHVPNSK